MIGLVALTLVDH